MNRWKPFSKVRHFSGLIKLTNIREHQDEIISCIEKVKVVNPLVHCITNRVTTEKVANSLLAFGSSPAMIDNPKEVEQFAKIASCTYFNLGLHTSQVDNIHVLEKMRQEKKKEEFTLIIDPIAVGATEYRTNLIKDIIVKCKPNVIKGNIAEIFYLDKGEFLGKGVDSNTSSAHNQSDIIASARNVALKYNCAVVVTSKADIIVSPCSNYVAQINCDLKILTKITGSACTAATLIYKLAAFKAYEKETGPGTLSHKIIDNIYFYSNNPHFLNFQVVDVYAVS
ncbi:hydroxyethylthiazole kinase [Plasmodium cynomolgi strain B]|uniref:hydroxyethylthiazole kinase n=1 Tax=Plasmodium cynomolgi (strain B) TaxID=1120755 RepID=K6UZ54_PLACD|nr:hydroxyethylthiazole kinase [Plasmodium cynomolgi strain B]GAB69224.1 hydroxyethylthiazole kinase [Plasmodium cynomolgi strain B]